MNMSKFLISAASLFIAANSYAQGGPTKEQTIEYIQSKYAGGIEYKISKSFADGLLIVEAGGDITNLKVSIAGSKIEFTYHLVTWEQSLGPPGSPPRKIDKDEYTTVRFDLKDIESIEGGVFNTWYTGGGVIEYQSADEGGGPLFLIFETQNAKKSISVVKNSVSEDVSKVWVPFDVDMVKTDHRAMHELKDTQLYKAFEHLRKLSGGPEPIRF